MDWDKNNFELDYKDGKIQVGQHSMETQVSIRIVFSNNSTFNYNKSQSF
jgi:hypothetical protein